jgi:hypothetical protein
MRRASEHYPGEAKTDRRDSFVLADTARTHARRLHWLEGDDETLERLRVIGGYDDDLAHNVNRAANRLRDMLLAISPALERVLGPRLDHPGARALLARYPTPTALRSSGGLIQTGPCSVTSVSAVVPLRCCRPRPAARHAGYSPGARSARRASPRSTRRRAGRPAVGRARQSPPGCAGRPAARRPAGHGQRRAGRPTSARRWRRGGLAKHAGMPAPGRIRQRRRGRDLSFAPRPGSGRGGVGQTPATPPTRNSRASSSSAAGTARISPASQARWGEPPDRPASSRAAESQQEGCCAVRDVGTLSRRPS